ncbi:MAG TPA: oligosaccharide flippase family protein [Chitinophagales bacterium]|nr:oligosaccharide flippase family protein [Chitinophagales bacterium]
MIFRKLAKDSAIYGGADFFSRVIAFFTFPLIAAALSPLAFGALELVATTTALLGLVINCGLNNAVQRFYWDKDTTVMQRPVIVSTGMALQIALGVLIIAVGALISPIIYPQAQKANLPFSWIALIAALFLMAANQWNQFILDVVRLHFTPWKFFILELLSKVLIAFAGVAVVVYFKWGIDGLLGIQALIMFALLPVALFMIRKDITSAIEVNWARELTKFGYPFIFAGMAFWLFSSMDRWMLALMSSVEEVGIYSVASKFSTIVLFASMAFGQAWSPFAMKIRTDNPDSYREIFAHVLLLLLFIMLLIGGILGLFSGELIAFLMPEEYRGSALPLIVLCFGIALQATQQVTATGISLEKKTFLFARLAWLTAGVNFVLNWVLIPAYGATGAAVATAIAYLLVTGSYLYYTQKLHPLPIPWKNLSVILCSGIMMTLIAVLWNQHTFSWRIAGLKLFVFAGVAGIGWLMLPVKKWENVQLLRQGR